MMAAPDDSSEGPLDSIVEVPKEHEAALQAAAERMAEVETLRAEMTITDEAGTRHFVGAFAGGVCAIGAAMSLAAASVFMFIRV